MNESFIVMSFVGYCPSDKLLYQCQKYAETVWCYNVKMDQ